tara:strand:- start:1409 stop:2056 length:648 start_codon:yes stop_codon:yes gene_type:complete
LEKEKKTTEMALLKRKYSSCTLCPKLCSSRKNIVWGTGNLDAKIVIVESHPDRVAEGHSLPMGGAPLALLERMLKGAKIPLRDVYMTTTVLCSPVTRQPTRSEQKRCFSRLSREIEIVDPWVVICLGPTAAKALTSVKSRFSGFVRHMDSPFMDAVTEGTSAPEVRRNAIVTYSLRDLYEKNEDVPLKKDSDAYWVFRGLEKARVLVEQFEDIYR